MDIPVLIIKVGLVVGVALWVFVAGFVVCRTSARRGGPKEAKAKVNERKSATPKPKTPLL